MEVLWRSALVFSTMSSISSGVIPRLRNSFQHMPRRPRSTFNLCHRPTSWNLGSLGQGPTVASQLVLAVTLYIHTPPAQPAPKIVVS